MDGVEFDKSHGVCCAGLTQHISPCKWIKSSNPIRIYPRVCDLCLYARASCMHFCCICGYVLGRWWGLSDSCELTDTWFFLLQTHKIPEVWGLFIHADSFWVIQIQGVCQLKLHNEILRSHLQGIGSQGTRWKRLCPLRQGRSALSLSLEGSWPRPPLILTFWSSI